MLQSHQLEPSPQHMVPLGSGSTIVALLSQSFSGDLSGVNYLCPIGVKSNQGVYLPIPLILLNPTDSLLPIVATRLWVTLQLTQCTRSSQSKRPLKSPGYFPIVQQEHMMSLIQNHYQDGVRIFLFRLKPASPRDQPPLITNQSRGLLCNYQCSLAYPLHSLDWLQSPRRSCLIPLAHLLSYYIQYVYHYNQLPRITKPNNNQLQLYRVPMNCRDKSYPYLSEHTDTSRMVSKQVEDARLRVDPHRQRVTQTNMVYLIGLPVWMARQQILRSQEYCGQYGPIVKTMVKKNYFNEYASYSAYITYGDDVSACLAVIGINNLVFDRNKIYASYGTNKYCAQFIKHGRCRKDDCPFVHEISIEKEISEEDNKKLFQDQQDLARNFFVANHHRIYFDSSLKGAFTTPNDILDRFIQEGTIPPLIRKSSIDNESQPNGKYAECQTTDCKSEVSTSSSPSKGSCEESLELGIQERILLKLSVTRSSIFSFAQKQQRGESKRICQLLKTVIVPTLVC